MVSIRNYSLIAVLGFVAWLLPSNAMGIDRPDLLDVDDEAYRAAQSNLPDNVDYSYAYAGAEEYDSVSASGVVYGRDGSEFAKVVWHIFEPDTVRRKSNLLDLRQKAYLALGLYIYDGRRTASISTTLVEDCQAQMKVTGENTNNTEAKWKVRCRPSALESLGLSESQLQTMEDIFGNRLNFRGTGPVLP